jgi:hypothetical protein
MREVFGARERKRARERNEETNMNTLENGDNFSSSWRASNERSFCLLLFAFYETKEFSEEII